MNFKNCVVLFKYRLGIGIKYLTCVVKSKVGRTRTFHNPQNHRGSFPVRVLQHNIIFWFETSSTAFFQTLLQELNANGLSPSIAWIFEENPIIIQRRTYAASINRQREIKLYEPFAAFLWCICYTLYVIFERSIEVPTLRGNYSGTIDETDKMVDEALNLYAFAMILRTRYQPWDLSLPNPQEINCKNQHYVSKVNGFFISAMYFILAHEVGHSHFGHVNYNTLTDEQSRREEQQADNFALEQVLRCTVPERESSLKIGAVFGLVALIFLSNSLRPSAKYPDADIRLNNAFQTLGFEDSHVAWGIASLGLKFWADENRIPLILPPEFEDHAGLFNEILLQFNNWKRANLRNI